MRTVIASLLPAVAANVCHAQWVQTNPPPPWSGHRINALAVSGTNLFAGTEGGGVWRRPLLEMFVEPAIS